MVKNKQNVWIFKRFVLHPRSFPVNKVKLDPHFYIYFLHIIYFLSYDILAMYLLLDIYAVCRLMNIGAVLNGIAGTVPFAGPALLASVWFPPSQRATATAIASAFNYFGVGMAFIIGNAWLSVNFKCLKVKFSTHMLNSSKYNVSTIKYTPPPPPHTHTQEWSWRDTVYSFEFAQSYFHPINIWDWFAQSWIHQPFNFLT